jgi:quinoprotein glucose dehydrogenase
LPRELLPQVSEALRKHAGKEADLAKLLTEVMKGGLLLSGDKTELERIEKLVHSKGNAQRGKELYLNGKLLACINCHRMEGVGGNVGPELTRLWDTSSIDKIMESIIDPSKEIKEGYETYSATTKKGQIYTGLRVSQNADEVVIKEATGNEVRIATKDLEEIVKTKTSLMPDNVVSQRSFEQFVDLVAFLKDRKSQESLRGMAFDFWVAGPLPADRTPEVKEIDPTKKLPGLKAGEEVAWQARQAEPKGYLNLRAAFSTPNTAAYALTYVYSPKAQSAEMLVGASDGLKVWLNDAPVHEHGERRPARPDADKVDVKLKEGWNKVLVSVVGVGQEHGLYLRFAGPTDLRLSLKQEAVTPAGK